MKIISQDYIPSKIGETKRIKLQNGAYIKSKWKKRNEFVLRYIPDNYSDYYTPYFLFRFYDDTNYKVFPYPNFRSFLLGTIAILILLYFKEITIDDVVPGCIAIFLFTIVIQTLIGLTLYKRIKKNAFNNQ
ncbi:hypothetical protein [Winogradskyella tangerina]|uniref:hypothetical protein n=1 Tax=Winogradskyella tangerina TaxID=2023240 RepID=UPI000DBE5E48|nr:hypothetical protein [Winogradskyella tangerina]